MSDAKNIILSEYNKDIQVSFELEFVDPNNLKMCWFNDYYTETATFEEIYNRYIEHPNAIKEVHHSKWRNLFEMNRNDCIVQMNKTIHDTECKEQHAIEEIATEIESICSIQIGLLLIDCAHPEPDDSHWALGVDDMIVLRSPFMSIPVALTSINYVIKGLNDRHFLSGSNSFRVYVKHKNKVIQEFNWFKVMVLYETQHTIEYLRGIPLANRKKQAHLLYTRVPEHDVRNTLERLLSRIKTTSFMFHNDIGVFSLSDNERYISDRANVLKWLSKILLIVAVATHTEHHRQEYIAQLKYVIKESGIKK